MNEEFDPAGQRGFSFIQEVYDWVEAGLTAVVCVVLIFVFVARIAGVSGESMHPTLEDGEKLIISRLAYTPGYGDIVVVTKPNRMNEPLIKRVIATEGQTVDINFDSGIVTVDGVVLGEPYIAEPTFNHYDVIFPQTVPENCVFVMGDNRNNSWDSRASAVGMIDTRYILGRVVYRISPYGRLGVPE